MKPLITTQLRLHLASGAIVEAPVELFVTALIRMLNPEGVARLAANIEEMKTQHANDLSIVLPDGGEYFPVANGVKHG